MMNNYNQETQQQQRQNRNALDALLSQNNFLPNDNWLTHEEEIRNTEYTSLIQNYQEYLKKTLQFKKITRWISFCIFIGSFLAITLFSIFVLCKISYAETSNLKDFISLFSAGISLVATIIVLPSKIIDFIYNKDEDSSIVEIIKSTQKYDKTNRLERH